MEGVRCYRRNSFVVNVRVQVLYDAVLPTEFQQYMKMAKYLITNIGHHYRCYGSMTTTSFPAIRSSWTPHYIQYNAEASTETAERGLATVDVQAHIHLALQHSTIILIKICGLASASVRLSMKFCNNISKYQNVKHCLFHRHPIYFQWMIPYSCRSFYTIYGFSNNIFIFNHI